MSNGDSRNLEELLRDSEKIRLAIKAGVHDAVRRHKLLGQPIVTMRDGKIVWVPPEEIKLPEDKNGSAPTP